MRHLSIERAEDHGWRLSAVQSFAQPIEEVFTFFAAAGNLQRITPPWLKFHVLSPGVEMRAGARIDYRLRIRLMPIRWQSLISEWSPPHRFVDEQTHGPYRWWRHEHLFEPHDGGTLVRDIVHYGVPGGWLVHELLVRRDVERIFQFRRQALHQVFL